jgi:hypothetical protein
MSTIVSKTPPAPKGSVALPSGGWVQLRPLDDLRSKHRKAVFESFPQDGDFGQPTNVLDMLRAVATVMVVAWHLPYEPAAALPSESPEVLDDLSVVDENALTKALGPALDLFNPSTLDPADHENPDSPTGPSGA